MLVLTAHFIRLLQAAIILAAFQSCAVGLAFSIATAPAAMSRSEVLPEFTTGAHLCRPRDRQLVLPSKQNNNDIDLDGTGRGSYLLTLVMLYVVWSFSIPVEFRRAHWCFSTTCEHNRSIPLCHNCVTVGEWTGAIVEYYRNGGGIQWDFSVGEETKELFGLK